MIVFWEEQLLIWISVESPNVVIWLVIEKSYHSKFFAPLKVSNLFKLSKYKKKIRKKNYWKNFYVKTDLSSCFATVSHLKTSRSWADQTPWGTPSSSLSARCCPRFRRLSSCVLPSASSGHPSARAAATTAWCPRSKATSATAASATACVPSARWSPSASGSWRHRWRYAGSRPERSLRWGTSPCSTSSSRPPTSSSSSSSSLPPPCPLLPSPLLLAPNYPCLQTLHLFQCRPLRAPCCLQTCWCHPTCLCRCPWLLPPSTRGTRVRRTPPLPPPWSPPLMTASAKTPNTLTPSMTPRAARNLHQVSCSF